MESTNTIECEALISKAEAAKLADRTESFVHYHAVGLRLPLLPSHRDGYQLRFKKSEVVSFMQNLRASQTAQHAERIANRVARMEAKLAAAKAAKQAAASASAE